VTEKRVVPDLVERSVFEQDARGSHQTYRFALRAIRRRGTRSGFFLPVKVLSRIFRGKFVAVLRRAYVRGDLDLAGATEGLRDSAQWHTFMDALFDTDWIVYAKPAFGGASAVLRYLGRYTHRVAISNHRLIAFDGEQLTFR
jgi:putative transposase